MASDPPSGTAACRLCGRPPSSTPRQYLNLEALCLHELPLHDDLDGHEGTQQPTLAVFLNSVLSEAYGIDFDDGTWSHHGKFPSANSCVKVDMPPSQSHGGKVVSFEVDKRVKGETSSAFLARRSYHDKLDVSYPELDAILAQDHCRKEAEYDPSVFDGNELLKWNEEDLQTVVTDLKPEWKVKSVQMSSEYAEFEPINHVVVLWNHAI